MECSLTSILPEESAIQVTLFADPNNDDLFSSYVAARTRPAHKELAKKRVEFLRNFTTNSPQAPYTLRNFRCLISFTQTFTKKVKITEVINVQRQLMTLLETVGISNHLWHASDLIAMMQGVLSLPEAWGRSSPSMKGEDLNYKQPNLNQEEMDSRRQSGYGWNGLADLKDQMIPLGFGLEVKDDGLVLKKGRGEITARSFGVKRYPDVWSLFAMGDLLGDMHRDQAQIPCPFFYELRYLCAKTRWACQSDYG